MNGVPEKVPFNGYYKLKPLNPKPWALNPKFRSTATMVAIGGLQEDAVAHDSDPYIRTMVQRLGTECSKGMMLFLVVGHVLMSCFLLWCVIALFLLFFCIAGHWGSSPSAGSGLRRGRVGFGLGASRGLNFEGYRF